jgi:hypothetical protein
MIPIVERRRRAFGAAFTAYGLLGLVAGLLVAVATIVVGLGLGPTIESLDRQRDAIVASLERSASVLDQTTIVLEDAAGAVGNSSDIASEAANVSRGVSDTLDRLAGTFGNFSVLGNRPFGPLTSDATQLAAQLRGIATDVDALGVRLAKIQRGIPPIATDLQATGAELATLADELAAFAPQEAVAGALPWLLVGVALLVVWLLVPAVAALALGIWLLRTPRLSAEA